MQSSGLVEQLSAHCVPFTRPDLRIRICQFWKLYGVGDRNQGPFPSRGKGFACSANHTGFWGSVCKGCCALSVDWPRNEAG